MSEVFKISDLRQFAGGTDHYYRHKLTSKLYTDGVRYVAEKANAYWLIDEIAASQFIPKIAVEEFQVWALKVVGSKAKLVVDDGNGRVIESLAIAYTDFPEPGVKFFYSGGVIYLPEEH